ncbi:protein tweety homolog 1-A isoform X4 [Octopus sinensis]|uniref:Protein tweety homolog n=1 Tax=Octopus sinensis TaxID=2607531 RepID=A0A6P7SCM3_9MOLL|nr:protein tweety homolog 1-A isoform X4 [Octopus sinensis]
MLNSVIGQYEKLWLADFFHRFPHVNFTWPWADSHFSSVNIPYFHTLLFWTGVFVGWAVIIQLLMFLYICCICCKKKKKKHREVKCIRCFMAIFIFVCAGSLAVGFYGNEETNRGMTKFITHLKSTTGTIRGSLSTIDTIDQLSTRITHNVAEVKYIFHSSIKNKTVSRDAIELIEKFVYNTKQMRDYCSFIRQQTEHNRLDTISALTTLVEPYRWIATLSLFSVHALISLLLLIGMLTCSRCLLIFCVLFGCLALMLIWIGGGLYLGTAVDFGDLCVNPDNYVKQQTSANMEAKVLNAYLKCTDLREPFAEKYNAALSAIVRANSTLSEALYMASPYNMGIKLRSLVRKIRLEVTAAVSNVSLLNQISGCSFIHNNYINALNGICHQSLIGVAFMSLVCGIVGVALTINICLATRASILFAKSLVYYPVDDTDPFLPRPPPYSYGTLPTAPNDPFQVDVRRSYLSESVAGSEETVPRRPGQYTESPPPACHTTDQLLEFIISARHPDSLHGKGFLA